ncbi:MAG: hypothetical protein FWC46_07710 [Actinomycetia bacterium]|nr:hypothetical protein [Actinomycetes bacterium]
MGDVSPQRRSFQIVAVIFVPLGVVLAAVGFALGWWAVLPDASQARTQATIVDLGYKTTTVTYEVDGQQYEAQLNESFSGDTVGKGIEVSYPIDAPASARSVRGGILLLGVLGGVGVIFAGLGAVFFVLAQQMGRRRKGLLRDGTRIEARVVGVDQNRMVRINGRNPWRIQCEGDVPGTPGPLRFTSDMWLDDPVPALQRAGATTLPVYVDPSNPAKRYTVDDSALRTR